MKQSHISIRSVCLVLVTVGVACNGKLIVDEDPPPDEGTSTENEPWTGNSAECPASASNGAPCQTEGEICAYRRPAEGEPGLSAYEACGCWEMGAGEMHFYCYNYGEEPSQCPDTEPQTGDSCFGLLGVGCLYPKRSACICGEESKTWRCAEGGRDISSPPETVSPNRPINAMNDYERAQWCSWLTTAYSGPGYPPPLEGPVDADGYTQGEGCMYVEAPMCHAMLPYLAASGCEANLAFSSCDASLSELTDCVTTALDNCWPSPHGCARYFDHPNCSGTVVVDTRAGQTGGTAGTSTGGTGGISTGGTAGTVLGTGGDSAPPFADCRVRVR